MNYWIDELTAADWDAVRAIYLQGITGGLATFETEAPPWERWDAGHHAFARLAARGEGGLLGWTALSPVSPRAAYRGVAEHSIYIHEDARGQGIGRALLTRLLSEAEANGIWTVQTAIFALNAPSLALHRACGFREVGRRERIAQLRGVWHDTILLEKRSSLL
jgi:L-amino acid N-acyltransferase YncA